jgi:hypothetical protein
VVELEKDLSHRQQLLDIIIVRRGPGAVRRPLPDGLDQLVDHNLITFKSFQEPLDDWALKELTGHYVNYRKQVSGDLLLPEASFGLYAICARRPRDLFATIQLESLQEGVYLCRRGSDAIRVLVAAELPKTEHNSLLHLFSAATDRVQYGAEHYTPPSARVSTIINKLFTSYRREGLTMPYTMDDFVKEILDELTPEERLRGLPAEERLRGLPTGQIEAYLRQRREEAKGRGKRRKPKS